MVTLFDTEHFKIRHCVKDDVDAYLKFWNDPLVMQYIGDGTWGGGMDKVIKALASNIASYKDGLGYCSVVQKSNNEVVGDAGLAILKETGEIEIGYLLRQDLWGQGFGIEIIQGLLEYGFQRLNLDKIVAVAHPENNASIGLLKKFGFICDSKGVFHNRPSLKFSLARQAYQSIKKV